MKAIVLIAATAVTALADFSYDSTSRVTGGMLLQLSSMPIPGMGEAKKALEPIVSRIAIKGDRMIHKSADSAMITDIAKETITTINYKDRTYSVLTFVQMKEQLERIGQSLSQQKDGKPGVSMDFDVKETGRTQTFDGLQCKEVILVTKMTAADPKSGQAGNFVMNDVMWIAKSVPGEDEMRKFHLRMAQKLQIDPAAFQQMASGGFGQGIAKAQEKARAMEGMPIVQIVTVGANADNLPKSADLPATSEALRLADEEAAKARQQQADAQRAATKAEVGDIAAQAGTQTAATAAAGSMGKYGGVTSGAIGRLGGLGGFGKKKQQQQPAAEQTPTPAATAKPPADSGVLMQMRIVDSGFSTASVDASLFGIPAGFAQTESPMLKRGK